MLDPINIIKTVGILGIFLCIFAESGLFFGFFLPGDTLLFSAGIFASQGYFTLSVVIIGCAAAAVLGDNVGYWTGKKMGRGLFKKKDSFLFSTEHLFKAEHFYKKYGPVTIITARFIPIVRTFAPIVAGVADMKYGKFLAYNIVGGVLWALFVPILGYYFGKIIPNPDTYLLPIVLVVMVVSFLIPVLMRVGYVVTGNKKIKS